MSCRGAKLPTMPNFIKLEGSNFQERATLLRYDQKVPDCYQARPCWQLIMTALAILTVYLLTCFVESEGLRSDWQEVHSHQTSLYPCAAL